MESFRGKDSCCFPGDAFVSPSSAPSLKEGGKAYSLLRMILPEMVLGSSVRNSTIRGYL